MNLFKTTLLLSLLTVILVLLGAHFGGSTGLTYAFFFAAVMNFVAYFFSDKIALAANRAKPVTREQLPRVYRIVESLTQRNNMPMPRIFVTPDPSPNAFATGRNPQHSAVAVTEGILNLLDDEELEGVLAHELAHVRNRDILTSSIAATLAGAITWIAHIGRWGMMFGGYGNSRDRDRGGIGGLFMLILAPIAATLVQLWVSRTREYEADATGAAMTHNPYALARALQKIHAYSQRVPTIASPSMAHMYINAPRLTGSDFATLFSTHPPMEKRIQRLIGRDHI